MSFGLKNAGTTYQRMMDMIFQPMLGRNVEAYVDNMVVTSINNETHTKDLQELFDTMNKYQLRLNWRNVFSTLKPTNSRFHVNKKGNRSKPRQMHDHNQYGKPPMCKRSPTTHRKDENIIQILVEK